MINMGKKIKHAREARGLSQAELANIIGVSDKTVSSWELGTRTPRMGAIEKICRYFDMPKSALLDDTPIKREALRIPVYGEIAAGTPIEAIEEILGYEEVWADEFSDGEYLALKIKGNSMEPRIKHGDVVIIRRQSDIDSGDVAAVIINGCEATVKEVVKDGQGITLIPFNEQYSPKQYSRYEIETLPVEIIGKVIELRGKFE